MMIEGKKQMAITVKENVYLFDIASDVKSMTCVFAPGHSILITFTMATFNVKLMDKDVMKYEANVSFNVSSNEAAAFMNGAIKLTRGHVDAIPHLGAVIDHMFDVYEHNQKSKVSELPPDSGKKDVL